MAKRNEAAESRPAVRPVRLTSDMSMPKLSAVEIGSYIAAFAGLFLVLHLQLLGALLAGMLVYQLVHMIAPVIEKTMTSGRARWVAVVIVAAVIVGGLAGGTFVHHRSFSARCPERSKASRSVHEAHVACAPASARLDRELSSCRCRADEGQGRRADANPRRHVAARRQRRGARLRACADWHDRGRDHRGGRAPDIRIGLPLSTALVTRVTRFSEAFRRIVFAQVKISAINATFTASVFAGGAAGVSRTAAAVENAGDGDVYRRIAAGDRQPDFERDHCGDFIVGVVWDGCGCRWSS